MVNCTLCTYRTVCKVISGGLGNISIQIEYESKKDQEAIKNKLWFKGKHIKKTSNHEVEKKMGDFALLNSESPLKCKVARKCILLSHHDQFLNCSCQVCVEGNLFKVTGLDVHCFAILFQNTYFAI